MTQPLTTDIVWFRRDLRLEDNPAWAAATRSGGRVVAVYVLEDRLLRSGRPERRALLFDGLRSLDRDLREVGGRLQVRAGDPTTIVPSLVDEYRATAVHVNSDVAPAARARDAAVAARVPAFHGHWGQYVHEPGRVLTRKGTISRVFTPFHRTWSSTSWLDWPEPVAVDVRDDPGEGLAVETVSAPFELGAEAAWGRLTAFLERVDDYPVDRDRLDGAGSELSVDLKYGTIGARRVAEVVGLHTPGRAAVVRQLAWRDWYAHLLWGRPELVDTPLAPFGHHLAWREDPEGFAAWCEGRTGFPVVDAAMRCLAETGTMPNRARMIAASFLVKDLLVDWRLGERWFRHHLLDADVPQNVGNWQWAAGTGPDAAPFFRVFNPVTQGRTHDASGGFVRRWVPELAALSDRFLHAPWDAAPLELAAAGVVLGNTYPFPLVDHAEARRRALAVHSAARAAAVAGSA